MILDGQADAWVAGVDGCSSGWVGFAVNPNTRATEVNVVDLGLWLSHRPMGLSVLAIDIPMGLIDGPRPCDQAARRLLRFPRCTSVFSPPCRAALDEPDHTCASRTNRTKTERGLSKQAWGIAPKIKQVDDAITPEHQRWVYEVHPEVSFWCLNDRCPLAYGKSRPEGRQDRLILLKKQFPEIERHVNSRPRGVGADDLLDAAVAAWSALRIWQSTAESVCRSGTDAKGLSVCIRY